MQSAFSIQAARVTSANLRSRRGATEREPRGRGGGATDKGGKGAARRRPPTRKTRGRGQRAGAHRTHTRGGSPTGAHLAAEGAAPRAPTSRNEGNKRKARLLRVRCSGGGAGAAHTELEPKWRTEPASQRLRRPRPRHAHGVRRKETNRQARPPGCAHGAPLVGHRGVQVRAASRHHPATQTLVSIVNTTDGSIRQWTLSDRPTHPTKSHALTCECGDTW